MSTFKVFIREMEGKHLDVFAGPDDVTADGVIVKDVRKGNITVGMSADFAPVSIRIRHAERFKAFKDAFGAKHKPSARLLERIKRTCFDEMSKIANDYKMKILEPEVFTEHCVA